MCWPSALQLLLQAGLELSQRLQGTAQDLLEAALEAVRPLGMDDPRVQRFCCLVEQLLQHGLTGKPAAASGWIPYLHSVPAVSSACAMLQVTIPQVSSRQCGVVLDRLFGQQSLALGANGRLNAAHTVIVYYSKVVGFRSAVVATESPG